MHLQTFAPRPGYLPLAKRIDRRASVRHMCSLETACAVSPAQEDEPDCLVELLDISTGGIGLALSQPFDVGTILEVELKNLIQGYAASYLVAVMHATPQAGRWFVGCKFPQQLSEQELKAWL